MSDRRVPETAPPLLRLDAATPVSISQNPIMPEPKQ